MSRFGRVIAGFSLLLLAACSSDSVSYTLGFSVDDPEDQAALTEAAQRVIQRRLEHIGEDGKVQVVHDGDTTKIRVDVGDSAVPDILTGELQQPLNFRIMQQVPEDQADIVVEGQGGFQETGIDNASLFSVAASEDDDGKGVIVLNFTDDGRAKLAKVFQESNGKYIGMFIRGQLASKLLVETGTLLDMIVIRDLPSAEIALLFADDVNVGLHVTFTPAS